MPTVTTPTGKPRIFVSSTIYDFRDLRSALKFWLEDLGYEVHMSDHADFGKPLDANSYDACFRTIDTCDYFVLLIGSRVGGLYNKTDSISITRAEYRHAYERLKEGKIAVIPFIRRDVWDVREDRKALEEYLRGDFRQMKELSAVEIDAVVKHESKFVTDAEAIFSFMNEVARSDEMRLAIKSGGGYPRGNWIHIFDSFQEVVAALRQAIGAVSNLRRRSLVINLTNEIASNLQGFLEKDKNIGTLRLDNWADVRSELAPQMNKCITGSSTIDSSIMGSFALACILYCERRHLKTMFLEEALLSGEFLEYTNESNSFRVGPLQSLLVDLRDSIQAYASLSRSVTEAGNLISKYASEFASKKKTVVVNNGDLITPIFMLDARERAFKNLIQAHKALCMGVLPSSPEGDGSIGPSFMFDVAVKPIPSIAEVENWLKSQP